MRSNNTTVIIIRGKILNELTYFVFYSRSKRVNRNFVKTWKMKLYNAIKI